MVCWVHFCRSEWGHLVPYVGGAIPRYDLQCKSARVLEIWQCNRFLKNRADSHPRDTKSGGEIVACKSVSDESGRQMVASKSVSDELGQQMVTSKSASDESDRQMVASKSASDESGRQIVAFKLALSYTLYTKTSAHMYSWFASSVSYIQLTKEW